MPDPVELKDIDLQPKAGKSYADITRDWREEFIYFLMLDRFHDSSVRTPNAGAARTDGVAAPSNFYGGKLVGVKDHLDYIATHIVRFYASNVAGQTRSASAAA